MLLQHKENISDCTYIAVNIKKQTLTLTTPNFSKTYLVSTAKNGVGEKEGSYCTPRGLHIIKHKIGFDAPLNAVFVARQFTGEIYCTQLAQSFPNRDWVLTRILRLAGLESHNTKSGYDSFSRYIYIHGTPDSEPMGVPLSHGCVRMRNADIVELFDYVSEGVMVEIFE